MENNRVKNISGEANEFESYECLNQFRTPLIEEIIKTLDISGHSKGLDAGCGLGFITRLLAEINGQSIQVTGLDISNENIEYAKSIHQTDEVHFISGDVNMLPFNDQAFDWAWSMVFIPILCLQELSEL